MNTAPGVGGMTGNFPPWKKLITRFSIEQLRRLQFLFNNDLSMYISDINYCLQRVIFLHAFWYLI
jgi:hypothetical protein